MKKKVITSKAELDEYIKEKNKEDELEINRLELEIIKMENEIELAKNLLTFEFEEGESDPWELDKNERIVLNINKHNGTPNGVNNLC